MKIRVLIYLSALGLCGCGMVPISDEQIGSITESVSQAAEGGVRMARPVLDGIVPGLTNIVAIFAGLLSGAGTKVGLKALQKKRGK